MDHYYDDVDARNEARMLERQTRGETITHSKGFRLARNTVKPVTPSLNLSEEALKEKIRAIEAKAKAQTPPAAEEENRAVGKENISSAKSASTQGEVIMFEDESEVARASNNGNGSSPIATTATVRAVKPPKSKTYPK